MEIQPSHDVGSVAQYNEQNQQIESGDGRDIENQLPSVLFVNERKVNYEDACDILYKAAMKDNWKGGEPILNKYPSFVRQKISIFGHTVLHIAALSRSIRFVRKLMNLMETCDLEVKDTSGNTAFFHAAASGFIEIAKAMRERNNNLPNIPGNSISFAGQLPISMAANIGHKAMVSYLFKVTSLDMLPQQEQLYLFHCTILNEMYVFSIGEVALNIFNKDRKLVANDILQGNADVLHTLSQKSLAISNQQGKMERFIEGAYSPVWTKFIGVISMAKTRFITLLRTLGVIPERYLLKKQAGVLLEELWAECERNADNNKLLDLIARERFVYNAAAAGNVEFLAVVIHNHPILIVEHYQDWTIFHFAVFNRQEKVFSLIHQIGGMKNLILQIRDINGNHILHLAGKLGYSNFNDKEKIMPPSFLRVSGAALQMQREILWFKEVEKLLPPSIRKTKNSDGKTPRELFTEEHKLLLKEGERWMKDTANSCMIVATLVATMVFAAGFTVPGGNNSDNGIPILLNLNGFTVFVISDAVALFSSIISIIMFLSILTSRYTEDDFLVSLPAKLFFGLTALFVSIVSMLLAFTATFFLVYSNNHKGWESKFIAACASIPVTLFGCLQYKLWFDVAKSTYWSKFLFKPGKHKLY